MVITEICGFRGLAGPGKDAALVGGGQGVELGESTSDDAVGASYRPCGAERVQASAAFAGSVVSASPHSASALVSSAS